MIKLTISLLIFKSDAIEVVYCDPTTAGNLILIDEDYSELIDTHNITGNWLYYTDNCRFSRSGIDLDRIWDNAYN